MVAGVNDGDTIEFGPGLYKDIGRDSVRLNLNKANLTVRGARDARLRRASGNCDPSKDTILTGSSGFNLRAANIRLEHFCFQNFNDGNLASTSPYGLAPIVIGLGGSNGTVRRNRIDNTIGMGLNGRAGTDSLAGVTIAENEFIDIGLIATNGAGTPIQPSAGTYSTQEPSALDFNSGRAKTDLRIVNNLFDGGAWAAVSLRSVTGGTISGNTFRNMAKSAVYLSGFPAISRSTTTPTRATTAPPGASSKSPTG